MQNDFQRIKAMDIRQVVKLPEWQKLRVGFLGTWKTTPVANVAQLRAFYDPADARKTRIVLNYLTGTGFRSGTIQHPAITAFREEVRENWATKLCCG